MTDGQATILLFEAALKITTKKKNAFLKYCTAVSTMIHEKVKEWGASKI